MGRVQDRGVDDVIEIDPHSAVGPIEAVSCGDSLFTSGEESVYRVLCLSVGGPGMWGGCLTRRRCCVWNGDGA